MSTTETPSPIAPHIQAIRDHLSLLIASSDHAAIHALIEELMPLADVAIEADEALTPDDWEPDDEF